MDEKLPQSIDEHFESLAKELNLRCKGDHICRGKEWSKYHFSLVPDCDPYPDEIIRYSPLGHRGDICNSCKRIIDYKREELRILFKDVTNSNHEESIVIIKAMNQKFDDLIDKVEKNGKEIRLLISEISYLRKELLELNKVNK